MSAQIVILPTTTPPPTAACCTTPPRGGSRGARATTVTPYCYTPCTPPTPPHGTPPGWGGWCKKLPPPTDGVIT